jgi:HK97 family phage prohead protease
MKDAINELISKQQERTMSEETIEHQEQPEHEEARKVERRFLTMEVECRDAEEGDGRTVEGYAAVFDTDADLGSFTEQIERGAFDAALQDPQLDVAALFNHDQNQILARNRAGEGSLKLWTDNKGLKYRFKLGDQSYAQDLAINLRMGLVNQSSFAFSIKEDEWSMRDGRDHRVIKDVRLHDISPVVFAAYGEATAASIRSQQPTEEQPTQPAATTSRDRAKAQLAIYNLNK